jgi:hypothetical protein
MSRPFLWKTCRVLSLGGHDCRSHRLEVFKYTKYTTGLLDRSNSSGVGTLFGHSTQFFKGLCTCGSRSTRSYMSLVACPSTMDSNNTTKDGSFNGDTQEDLDAWLQERGVDTELFGTVNGSKTLTCLLHEVAEGESVLETTEDGKPLRMVSIISVNIKNKQGQSLYEAKQRLPGGGVRERNLFLSEKLLPNESWKAATRRGIVEELGSILPENPDIYVLDDTYSTSTERSTSSSYPGLCTEYVCHKVEARVSGLPETDFMTEENRPDGVLLSSWAWRDSSPLQ